MKFTGYCSMGLEQLVKNRYERYRYSLCSCVRLWKVVDKKLPVATVGFCESLLRCTCVTCCGSESSLASVFRDSYEYEVLTVRAKMEF